MADSAMNNKNDVEDAAAVTTLDKTNNNRPVVLKVEHVAKSFRLPTEQASGPKMAFLNWTRGIKGYTEQQVLRDINFEVHQGDFFGIVGRNGSGKSTLLKIISQIYVPEKGNVTVQGKLVPFIELGVGFNPELTGRENVYLNGALLGFTCEEIDAMYDDIVEFAELGEFMDQKLKNYSSGMQVRLAFSVAIKAQGDILVLDEVLAVGDEAFQRKCDNFFSEIKKDPTKTVILVTHSMESVKKYCTKAILIKDGEIVASGNKNYVADQYTLENLKVEEKTAKNDVSESGYPAGLNERCPLLEIHAVDSLMCDGSVPFRFYIEYEFNENDEYYFPVTIFDSKRGGISYDSGKLIRAKGTGHQRLYLELPLTLFNDGDFYMQVSLRVDHRVNGEVKVDRVAFTTGSNACNFVIRRHRKESDYALLQQDAVDISIFKQEHIN